MKTTPSFNLEEYIAKHTHDNPTATIWLVTEVDDGEVEFSRIPDARRPDGILLGILIVDAIDPVTHIGAVRVESLVNYGSTNPNDLARQTEIEAAIVRAWASVHNSREVYRLGAPAKPSRLT
jgi:hypothetical protein